MIYQAHPGLWGVQGGGGMRWRGSGAIRCCWMRSRLVGWRVPSAGGAGVTRDRGGGVGCVPGQVAGGEGAWPGAGDGHGWG